MTNRGIVWVVAGVSAAAIGCGTSSSPSIIDGAAGAGGSAGLHWFTTCGEPVCQTNNDGGPPDSGVSACGGGEQMGGSCDIQGATCDPGHGCGVLLLCSDRDPKVQTGGCPVSRRSAKRDIVYLDDAAIDNLAAKLRALRLATYRYKDNPSRERLGFVIDDGAGKLAVDEARDQIDLYAYMSWAVGALQSQMKRLDAQEREIASLRHQLASSARRPVGR